MRITTEVADRDLTTRARLRNSAIEVFAVSGFTASMRDIAAHAGVSAGLITHHFGSKQKLREECDAEVLLHYSRLKSEGIAMSPTQTMTMMAELDSYASMFVYILRSVRDGGAAGVTFLENMIEEAVAFSEEGIATGVVRPSRDPRARARFLVTSSLGGLLLQLSLHPHLDLADIGPTVRRLVEDITLPTLEIYTEGVLTDRRYLDEYLSYLNNPATTSSESTP
ncbi:MAG: TetR family transcriptional regulator [Lacisediminihabitans sp.]